MITKDIILDVLIEIAKTMEDEKDYLVELDQQNGDGDLGISMNPSFSNIDTLLRHDDETADR